MYQLHPKPTAVDIDIAAIPDELKALPQWVNWALKERDGRPPSKVPHNSRTGEKAKSNNPETWSAFEAAVEAREAYSGIGFVFSSEDEFTGIDLDHCRDPLTGQIEAWAWEWVKRFDGYVEVSPSGDGLHIIVRGKSPHNGGTTVDGKKVEIYSERRFFTITGVRP